MLYTGPAYHSFFRLCIVVAVWLSYIMVGNAQISPGKLTRAHASLEGISNCTKCHELGAKISEQKCLDCHQPLRNRINQNKGFHTSVGVKGKQCISCHSEHHGLTFEMVRFDVKNFNHSLTGYELKGAHKGVDCAQCHAPANMTDIKLKLNPDTYLGLNPSCISCHEDKHQKTLGNDCSKCHNTEKFVPASGFNHDKTAFPLSGAHVHVQCTDCHKTEIRNGKDFQQFSGVQHKNCNACHKDPHQGNYVDALPICHSTESFSKMKSTSAFNHSLTGFVLEGKHKVLDCKKCHDKRSGTKDNYQEFISEKNITCLTCHEDVHENKFGPDCRTCHEQQSFSIKKIPKPFDHNLTGYTLSGKHSTTDCRKCHTQPYMTADIKHDACKDCHQDYHEGEFAHLEKNDCHSCHDTNGFTETSFDFERHALSGFPLEGAHFATPCNACHLENNTRWTFRDIGSGCIDCHNNIHQGFIPQKYIPNNDCTKCHDSNSWSSIRFDHHQTEFTLEGQHQITSCTSCHWKEKNDINTQRFAQLEQRCASCHNNIHGAQFQENGVTDCRKCHGFNKWDKSNFNHDHTRFKLEGAHQLLECKKCHPAEMDQGVQKVVYKTGKIACADCHN